MWIYTPMKKISANKEAIKRTLRVFIEKVSSVCMVAVWIKGRAPFARIVREYLR